MKTQKFMGRFSLVDRLAAQVGDRNLAIGILQKRGMLKADGRTFTDLGIKRDAMTASERAIDRLSKKMGLSPSDFYYDPTSNRAKLLKGV